MERKTGIITKVQTNTNLGELDSSGVSYLYLSDRNWQIGEIVTFIVITAKKEGREIELAINLMSYGINQSQGLEKTKGSSLPDIEGPPHPKHGTISDPEPGVATPIEYIDKEIKYSWGFKVVCFVKVSGIAFETDLDTKDIEVYFHDSVKDIPGHGIKIVITEIANQPHV